MENYRLKNFSARVEMKNNFIALMASLCVVRVRLKLLAIIMLMPPASSFNYLNLDYKVSSSSLPLPLGTRFSQMSSEIFRQRHEKAFTKKS